MEKIVAIFVVVLIFLVKFLWNKRRLYYCGWKIPGPFALPLIGSLQIVSSAYKDSYKTIIECCQSQPPIFKLWLGNNLYIGNSEPIDVEILLGKCLEKGPFYNVWNEFANNTIITSPVSIWKNRRKLFNHSFNSKILTTFHENFVRYSKKLVTILNSKCDKVQTDLLTDIWRCNLDLAIETLADLNPELLEDRYKSINYVVRAEKIVTERFRKFWLLSNIFWKFSSLHKEAKYISKASRKISRKLLILKKLQSYSENSSTSNMRRKRFLPYLLDLGHCLEEEDLAEELGVMVTAASETTSATILSVLLMLALFPEVQNKLYEEILQCSKSWEDLSLENINSLAYLERVIKETMRIIPIIPLIMRFVDEDITTDSYTFPAGSIVAIPIIHIHRRPDLWPDPLKFDPDRFLPGEVAKRHRCAYLPFGFGNRNCIGLRYGMMSLKIMLGYIVKNFQIDVLNYRSLEEVQFDHHILAIPKGYHMKLEKRKILV